MTRFPTTMRCKQILLITLLFWWVIPTITFAATIGKPNNYVSLNSGLVGWWTFDGADMSPNVRDRSGQGNHGYITGQTSTTTMGGELGQALFFDGVDDQVGVPAASSINDLPALTVSFWTKSTTLGSTRPYVAKADNAAGGHGWLISQHTSGSFRFQVPGFTTTDMDVVSANGAFVLDQWAHYTVTWDGTNQASGVRLYKNGVELSYSTQTNGGSASPQTDAGRDLKMGVESGIGSNYVHGLVDDVRVYNRVLSATEIRQLARLGGARLSTTPRPVASDNVLAQGLVGHWTFDGADMRPNVRDRSDQGNHGNLLGQTATTTVSGKLGQGLFLDGVDDAVSIPDAGSLDITDALTLSAWVQMTGVHVNGETIVNKGNTAGGSIPTQSYRLDFYDNRRPRFAVSSGSTILEVTAPSNFLRKDGWYHLVGVFDGVETSYFYINNQLVGSNTSVGFGAINIDDTYGLGIGARADASALTTSAINVDDVRVYNRALSVAEVALLYAEGNTKVAVSEVGGSTLSSGLVGYWTLDARNTNWSSGVTTDIVGGLSGQLIAMSTTSTPRPGRVGQSFFFDGTSTEISLTNDLFDSYNEGTVSAWVKIPEKIGSASMRAVFGQGSSSGGENNLLLGLSGYDGVTRIGLLTAVTSPDTIRYGSTELSPNIWYHVTFVSDGSTWSLYVNGVLQSLTNYLGFGNGQWFADTVSGTDRYTIGLYNDAGVKSNYFKGDIDDVRIYNRALSATEVQQLYNMGR